MNEKLKAFLEELQKALGGNPAPLDAAINELIVEIEKQEHP